MFWVTRSEPAVPCGAVGPADRLPAEVGLDPGGRSLVEIGGEVAKRGAYAVDDVLHRVRMLVGDEDRRHREGDPVAAGAVGRGVADLCVTALAGDHPGVLGADGGAVGQGDRRPLDRPGTGVDHADLRERDRPALVRHMWSGKGRDSADRQVVVLDQDRDQLTVGIRTELPLGHRGDRGRMAERGEVAALGDLDVQVAAGGAAVQVRGPRTVRPLPGQVQERPLGGQPEPLHLQRRFGDRGGDDRLAVVLWQRAGEGPGRVTGAGPDGVQDAAWVGPVRVGLQPSPPQLGHTVAGDRPGRRDEPAVGIRREDQRVDDLEGGDVVTRLGVQVALETAGECPVIQVQGPRGQVEQGAQRIWGALGQRVHDPGLAGGAGADSLGRRGVSGADGGLDGVLGAEDEAYAGEGLADVDPDQSVGFRIDIEVEQLDGQPELVVSPDDLLGPGRAGQRTRRRQRCGLSKCGHDHKVTRRDDPIRVSPKLPAAQQHPQRCRLDRPALNFQRHRRRTTSRSCAHRFER